MGLRIEKDTPVKYEVDYYDHPVTVTCRRPTTRELDAHTADLVKWSGGKAKTDATASRKHVVKLITAISGLDIKEDNGEWRTITAVSDVERKYLSDEHSALLACIAGKVFNPCGEAIEDDEDSVPLA